MTPIQTLEIRSGEIRKRLADIGSMDALTDETRSELDALKLEYSDNDSKRAALTIAGDAPVTHIETRSAEGREFRSLVNGSNVGEIFDAALGKRSVGGATKELQDHYGLDSNQVPLALLVKDWPDNDHLETRAVTPAPSNVGQDQMTIIPYVFPMSSASYLGVDMPTVGVGEAVFPVLTKELDVRTPAESAEATETTGSFSADVLTPSRVQAAFFYSREDRARFAGMDAALRANLSEGLSDGLDDQILTGTNGLFTGTNLTNNAQTTNDTFDSYLNNLCWNQIDGRYASTPSDLMMVVGSATLKDLGQTYRNTSVDTEPTRKIDILVGHDFGKPIASRQSGTLTIADSAEAVTFEATLPDDAMAPSWVKDVVLAIQGGTMVGLSPGFREPPPGVGCTQRRATGAQTRTWQPRRD